MSAIFFHERNFSWKQNPSYPQDLKDVYRYKHLVDEPALSLGLLELDVGAYYPPHAHPAPEIYYVMDGVALWNVAGEEFQVEKGSFVKHKSGVDHSFRNTGTHTLKMLWVWWAENGAEELLKVAARLT